MRPTIPKNIDDFKNIQADDLTLRKPTPAEAESIAQFIKKYNSMSTIPIILAFIVGTAIPVLALVTMKEMNREILEFALCFAGLFYLVAILVMRNRLNGSKPLKGLQMGVANGVWSYRGGTDSKRSYYLDVVFPEEKRRVKKVICLKKDYESVNRGDEVLVFTYDNKRVFGCILK